MSEPSPEPPHVRAAALRALAALALPAAAVVLLACGGSSNPNAAAASERSSERSEELKAANFAKCLREHGIEASASADGGALRLRVHPKQGVGPQTFEAAQKACAKYRPGLKKVNLSPQERVKREEEVLKFAKCMREHGIHLNATVGGGKVAIGIHRGAGGPNPESPAFQAALKACSGDLPSKLGSRVGPGPLGRSQPPPVGG